MADEILQRDQNHIVVLGAVTDDAAMEIRMLRVDPITKRLLISATGIGAGTVTSISQGVGIELTPNPITTTGTVALSTPLQPIATLAGNSLKFLRVNAGETAVEYATVNSGLIVGTTTITNGTTTRILYNNAGILGEYTLTGTGTVVVMQTSPSLLTSLLMDSGFVMNWASSNVVLAHTSGILTLGTGTLKITTPTNTSTSVVTIDGTQSLTNKTYNGNTWTAGSGVLTIAAAKTLTANSTLTLAGTDGKTLTVSNSGTLAGGDAFVLAIAASKTLTVSNTITLAGTDSTVMTFPTTSATIARTDAAQTFTGVQTFSTPIATGSVATMTSTVGGGVPTPPNNTTTFLRGDGTFAVPASGGVFTQLASTSITGSSNITISSGTFTTKEIIKFILMIPSIAADDDIRLTINGDTSAIYADRSSTNGAADNAGTSRNNIRAYVSGPNLKNMIIIEGIIQNLSGVNKSVIGSTVTAFTSAASGNSRCEFVGDYVSTTDVTAIAFSTTSGKEMSIGTKLYVYGNNF